MSGVHWLPKSVQLTQLEPADAAPRPAVTFAADVLALPMRRADTDLFGYFNAQAEALLEATPGDDAVVRTRRAILEGLKGGDPTVGQVASVLATTESTLRRRLAERGTSFKVLVEEVRLELVRCYLVNPRLSLSEVAFLLGFSEPSAFHRAFRRWTGRTPLEFRNLPGTLRDSAG